eukprot:9168990-Alexandrium_andersonii.AAC.1
MHACATAEHGKNVWNVGACSCAQTATHDDDWPSLPPRRARARHASYDLQACRSAVDDLHSQPPLGSGVWAFEA